MARIKVTGYLNTDEMEPRDVDLDNPMGISENAYIGWAGGAVPLPQLDDLDFELEN